jgi:succinate dehydrogenase / fumarate reductase, cytochrome b subunit
MKLTDARNPARPLSPHLSIWKWGPHMLVSIVHRATGSGMATVGTVLLVWWLSALAAGPAAYGEFMSVFTTLWGGALGYLFGIGLTFSFFQHMASGVRHLFMDAGANFELGANKRTAVLTFVVSTVLTAALWAWIILEKSNG